MAEFTAELNRLAGTTDLYAQGAANAWAGTTQMELVGALNQLAGTTGLGLNGVVKRLAVLWDGDPTKDLGDALDTAIKFTLFPAEDIFPELDIYPGVA